MSLIINFLIRSPYMRLFKGCNKTSNQTKKVRFGLLFAIEVPSAFCQLSRSALPAGYDLICPDTINWSQTFDDFMSFFYRKTVARTAVEFIPHISQCLLLLGMSIERYILICHPTRSTDLLSIKRRLLFYGILTTTIFGLSVVPIVDIFLQPSFVSYLELLFSKCFEIVLQ